MYLDAEKVEVDSDEGLFTLVIEAEDGERYTFGIHGIDLDAFYDQVRGRIGPYLREKEEAFAEFRQAVKSGTGPAAAFLCAAEDIDESGGYAANDPKSPQFHSVHADIWDAREGK